MRLSSMPDDPGHERFSVLLNAGVEAFAYVDDCEIKEVYLADEEAGLVERFKTDETGRPIMNMERGVFETETLRGKVRIDLRARK